MWHSPPPTNTSKIPGLFRPGDGEGQGSLVCCSPRGRRVRHDRATEKQQCWYTRIHERKRQPTGDFQLVECGIHLKGLVAWMPAVSSRELLTQETRMTAPLSAYTRPLGFFYCRFTGRWKNSRDTVLHLSYPQVSDDKWHPKSLHLTKDLFICWVNQVRQTNLSMSLPVYFSFLIKQNLLLDSL